MHLAFNTILLLWLKVTATSFKEGENKKSIHF